MQSWVSAWFDVIDRICLIALLVTGLKKPPSARAANEDAKRALGNIASTLGGSFMVLPHDHHGDHDNPGLDFSMISLPTISTEHLPHHQQQHLRTIQPQQQQQQRPDTKVSVPANPYQSSIIPFWSKPGNDTAPSTALSAPSSSGRPTSTSNPSQASTERASGKQHYSAIDGLDWNTQSFMHHSTAPPHPSASKVTSSSSSSSSSSTVDAVVPQLLETISKLRKLCPIVVCMCD